MPLKASGSPELATASHNALVFGVLGKLPETRVYLGLVRFQPRAQGSLESSLSPGLSPRVFLPESLASVNPVPGYFGCQFGRIWDYLGDKALAHL